MRKITSITLAFIMLIGLCAMSACSPAAVEITELDGYTYYESPNAKIKFQFPEEWTEMSADTLSDPDVAQKLAELMGMSADLMQGALQNTDSYFYNFNDSDGVFTPSLNLVVSEGSGVTQRQLRNKSAIEQSKEQIASEYSTVFRDFTWRTEPEGKKIGNNTFLTYICDYTIDYEFGAVSVSSLQAMTANDGNLYTFTYTSHEGTIEGNISTILENILSTVEFIK